jgi:hypothetical protein
MNTYEVTLTCTASTSVEVEAESEDEAKVIAVKNAYAFDSVLPAEFDEDDWTFAAGDVQVIDEDEADQDDASLIKEDLRNTWLLNEREDD